MNYFVNIRLGVVQYYVTVGILTKKHKLKHTHRPNVILDRTLIIVADLIRFSDMVLQSNNYVFLGIIVNT